MYVSKSMNVINSFVKTSRKYILLVTYIWQCVWSAKIAFNTLIQSASYITWHVFFDTTYLNLCTIQQSLLPPWYPVKICSIVHVKDWCSLSYNSIYMFNVWRVNTARPQYCPILPFLATQPALLTSPSFWFPLISPSFTISFHDWLKPSLLKIDWKNKW